MLQILERELTRVSRDDLTVEVLTWRVRMDEYYCLLSNTVDCLEEGLECCVSQVIALVVKQQTNTDGSQAFVYGNRITVRKLNLSEYVLTS